MTYVVGLRVRSVLLTQLCLFCCMGVASAVYATSDDYLYGMAVDCAGAVVAAGASVCGSSGGTDYATVKLSPDGEILWTAVYDGLDPTIDSDWAQDLRLVGGVAPVVTGSSARYGPPSDVGEPGNNSDIVTIHYDWDGDVVWNSVYDSGETEYGTWAALDSIGNTIVGGLACTDWPDSHGGICSLLTMKIDENGDTVWVDRFSGCADRLATADGIVLDPDGGVYSFGYGRCVGAGSDYFVVRYSPDGDRLWDTTLKRSYNEGVSLANGESVFTGSTYPGPYIHTTKLDENGDVVWEVPLPEDAWAYGSGGGILADSNGDVYVSGSFGEYGLLKLDGDGNILWAGSAQSDNVYYNFALQAWDTSVVIGGQFTNEYPDNEGRNRGDIAVQKFDPQGNQLWSAWYPCDGGCDWINRMDLDMQGNIILAGWYKRSDADLDFIVVKFDPAGNLVWSTTFDGGGECAAHHYASADNACYHPSSSDDDSSPDDHDSAVSSSDDDDGGGACGC